ncbi:hypothetical protein GCM10027072_79560 [Streptomyces bullii]
MQAARPKVWSIPGVGVMIAPTHMASPTVSAVAMEQYAAFYGAWHHYFGSYTWQPLNGGHRALGDMLVARTASGVTPRSSPRYTKRPSARLRMGDGWPSPLVEGYTLA